MLKHGEKLKNEEHDRHMKMAEEQHKRRMEMADEEHVQRMEMAKEEHETKMQILRQKLKLAVMETEILKIKTARGRGECDSDSANEGSLIL